MKTVFFYIIMCIMPFISVTKVVIQGRISKDFLDTLQRLMLFNSIQFIVAAAVNTLLNVRSAPTDLWFILGIAAITSVLSISFQTFYTLALRSGPVGKTCIITNFSAFVPLCFGVLFFHEPFGIIKTAALICMAVAFVLIPKDSGEPVNFRWFILSVAALLCNGFTNVVLMFVGKTASLNEDKSFYFTFVFLFAAVITFAIYGYLCRMKPAEGNGIGVLLGNKRYVLSGAAIGALICIYNYCIPLVLSRVDSTVFYPITTLGVMIVSVLSGVVLFRERVSARSLIGIVIAMVSILLTTV